MKFILRVKGSPTSGWYSPPKGTHSGDKHREVGSGKVRLVGKKPFGMGASAAKDYVASNVKQMTMAGSRIHLDNVSGSAKDEIASALSHVDGKILRSHYLAGGIRVVDDSTWATLSKRYKLSKITAAYYDPTSKSVVLQRGGDVRHLYHELGHVAFNSSTNKSQWYDNYAKVPNFARHTAYSILGGSKEAFAESYMLYVEDKGVASVEGRARTYAGVERVLTGVT